MIGDGVSGILRDLDELVSGGPIGWVILAGIALLPVLGVALSVAGSRLAIVPVVIFAGVALVWFAYYATDWWPNPGLAGTMPMAFALLIGWVVLAVAAWGYWRRRAFVQH